MRSQASTLATGVVYTPREVAEPMVHRALAPLLARRAPESLRVCDPAIGEGAFLVEVIRMLVVAGGDRREIAAHCVFGVDIDGRAVAAARAAIEVFVGAPVPELREHLRVADALADPWPDRAFDAVVGNPPYVRQELFAARKRELAQFAVFDGAADLYVYFIELAHRLLAPGGRYCLVVPNKWLTAAYGRPLREFLSRAASLEGLVDFHRALPLFGDADAFPCIAWGEIGVQRSSPVRAACATTSDVATALATTHDHARERWSSEPWHVDAPADAALIDRLAARWPRLGDVIGKPSRGVVTGCNRAFVIDAVTRTRLVAAEPAAAALIRPLVKGRDVRRWRTDLGDRYIVLVDRGTSLARLPGVLAHLAQFRTELEPRAPGARGPGRKPGAYRWYELQDPVGALAKSRAPRLLYQDIQTRPVCSLDRTGALVPDTTVWSLPTDDHVTLAVLNSTLYGWYARRRFPPALNGAVRPKASYLAAFPLAQPSAAARRTIEGMVAMQVWTATAELDRELDRAVCDLYELDRAERARLSAT